MIECVLYHTALEPNDTALRASRRDLALGVFSGDGQPRLSLREGLGRRSGWPMLRIAIRLLADAG